MKTRFILMLLSAGMILLVNSGCKKESSNNPDYGSYVVFSWNDLGMHCANPSYDKLVILPPYNTILAQVVKRGNPPQVVTSGIVVKYSVVNNIYSYGKGSYGGFWDYSQQLFGTTLPNNIGLTGSAMAGNMIVENNHFIITGVPVTPYDDNLTWNPYQVAVIVVEDLNGNVLATTTNTVPVSDEINCAKCHGANAFDDILTKHDAAESTSLMANKPVLCASCHPDPALGAQGTSIMYLSQAIHGFHADKGAACYDCHPGETTQCNRSLRHTSADGNCITCHGDLANIASTIADGRVPWGSEPACVTCHTNVDGVNTGTALYRNSEGHGNLYCSACHGSPHAMYPSSLLSDNAQPLQYQDFGSNIKTIGSCGACHSNSRGEGSDEFGEAHGGSNPEHENACHICHTEVSSNPAQWPHAYTWKNSNTKK
jgi:hypothetical protein